MRPDEWSGAPREGMRASLDGAGAELGPGLLVARLSQGREAWRSVAQEGQRLGLEGDSTPGGVKIARTG